MRLLFTLRKENIWTFDSKGELLLTIMSSLAQEESRSISENVTWGHWKRFADGKVSLAYSRFLGYDKGPDGTLVVNQEQAKTVKLIYKLFLDGLTMHTIADELTKRGIKTPGGKDKWSQSTVKSILTNEKYKGDALLQKSYTVDFLTKKHKTNEGEVPQYYVEDNHEQSSSRRFLNWYRQKSADGIRARNATVASAFSPPRFNAQSAAAGTAPRFGTPTTSTAALSTSATTSSERKPAARRRI